MARILHPLLLLFFSAGLLAQTTTDHRLLFEVASDQLSEDVVRQAVHFCDDVDRSKLRFIQITGHADARGGEAYNRDLSQRRAQAVYDLLVDQCAFDVPVEIDWLGESLASNDLSSDRRVDVTFFYHSPFPEELHRHKHVRPLMPTLDVPRSHYTAEASSEIDIVAEDGVRIKIPAGAIVNAKGEPVQGKIDLTYRGFHEPYEIIASGIPMHVNTADGMGHFETAGMYELYASQNGEALHLALGRTITIERPGSERLDEDFMGWDLDADLGVWQPAGDLRSAPMIWRNTFNIGTAATEFYWREFRRLQAQELPDSSTFAERRRSSAYCHLTPCDPSATETRWRKKRDQFEDNNKIPSIRVVGYKGIYDPDRIIFTIDMDVHQYPEWRRIPYRAIWEYVGNDSRATFKRLYGKRHSYQDIDLVMEPGEDTGLLRLKENGEWLSLPVSAQWNMTDERSAGRWTKSLSLYEKALAKRESMFDRRVQREYERARRMTGDPGTAAWRACQPRMNEEEQAMDLEAWSAYVQTRPDWVMRNAMTDQAFAEVRTTFDLQGFGLFNIDRIMKMPERQDVIAATVDENDLPFPWVNGYAVLKDENSVITYWGNGDGRSDNLLVAPGKIRSLYLVDALGNIAIADVTPLNSGDRRVTMKVKAFNVPETLDELRAQTDP